MSGPFSFTVAVISGQKDSDVLVVGASAFLYVGWMSLDLISPNKGLRDEIYSCLDLFSMRGHFVNRPDISHAKYSAKRIKNNLTDDSISASLFWIALDKQGYSLAEKFFDQKGILPKERVYKSVNKLNLVENPMPPYPDGQTTKDFFREVKSRLQAIDDENKEVKWEVGRQALYEKYAPMTEIERKYYLWYKSLQDNLLPWRSMIKEIQSAWS